MTSSPGLSAKMQCVVLNDPSSLSYASFTSINTPLEQPIVIRRIILLPSYSTRSPHCLLSEKRPCNFHFNLSNEQRNRRIYFLITLPCSVDRTCSPAFLNHYLRCQCRAHNVRSVLRECHLLFIPSQTRCYIVPNRRQATISSVVHKSLENSQTRYRLYCT